jgi:hypothetical protein
MILIPSSFGKFFSRFQSKHSQTSLPTFQQSSQSTLFDDLPEKEKAAALSKLYDLAAAQPGQVSHSEHRRRRFSW